VEFPGVPSSLLSSEGSEIGFKGPTLFLATSPSETRLFAHRKFVPEEKGWCLEGKCNSFTGGYTVSNNSSNNNKAFFCLHLCGKWSEKFCTKHV
jgi:hypothetical protein